MKLIFDVDAIIPPFSGIGRYAWELARYFIQHDECFDDLRFHYQGNWVDDRQALGVGSLLGLRSVLGRYAKLYKSHRRLARWAVHRAMRGHCFHSPNYFLPQGVRDGIVTIHDLSIFKYPETHPRERIEHFRINFDDSLKRAVHLITDSEAMRSEVATFFGWPEQKITAIPLGVPRGFRPSAEPDISPVLARYGLAYGRYALCVATLEPRKGIDSLIDAYGDLPSELRLACPLMLAGVRGWLSDDLMTRIRLAADENWLHYLGYVPEADLPMLYSGARAFCFPSRYEGFGLPVLEAMASGVPTLTSNASSLPEVAGGAAWLVEPDDRDALRDGLARVLTDEAWRATAARRGLAVAAEATWERCALHTLDVYRRYVEV
ncbi:MAG: glycosyltransferase family 1 protein [Burkholderia sp.]|nr:MAG: D-inositol-3-phosphate glycosyltransferase [Burkholderia gladioli]